MNLEIAQDIYPFEVLPSKSGAPIIRREGRYLASSYDPESEAKIWCRSVAAETLPNTHAFVVLGCGSGYHVVELSRQFPHSIVIAIDDDAPTIDFCKGLFGKINQNIQWVFAQNEETISKNDAVVSALSGQYRVVLHRASAQFSLDLMLNIRDFLNARTERGFQNLLSIRQNLKQLLVTELPTVWPRSAQRDVMTIKTIANLVRSGGPHVSIDHQLFLALEELIK
jgi:hypothetical protein